MLQTGSQETKQLWNWRVFFPEATGRGSWRIGEAVGGALRSNLLGTVPRSKGKILTSETDNERPCGELRLSRKLVLASWNLLAFASSGGCPTQKKHQNQTKTAFSVGFFLGNFVFFWWGSCLWIGPSRNPTVYQSLAAWPGWTIP